MEDNSERAGEAPAATEDAVAVEIANALLMDATDGAETLDDADDDTRASLMGSARVAVRAFLLWAGQEGYRISPPGAFPAPTSAEEARAMAQAAKDFFAGQGRKHAALATPARGLILPAGFNGKAH